MREERAQAAQLRGEVTALPSAPSASAVNSRSWPRLYIGSTMQRAMALGRKTQHRHVVTPVELERLDPEDPADMTTLIRRCPFGLPGELLAIPGLAPVAILEVRVERVQSISKVDAIDEGLTPMSKDGGETFRYGLTDRDGTAEGKDTGWTWFEWEADPRRAFRKVWDSIHFMRPGQAWSDNPWVWAIRFRVVG